MQRGGNLSLFDVIWTLKLFKNLHFASMTACQQCNATEQKAQELILMQLRGTTFQVCWLSSFKPAIHFVFVMEICAAQR